MDRGACWATWATRSRKESATTNWLTHITVALCLKFSHGQRAGRGHGGGKDHGALLRFTVKALDLSWRWVGQSWDIYEISGVWVKAGLSKQSGVRLGWLKVHDKISWEKQIQQVLRTYTLLSIPDWVHECSFKLILQKVLRLVVKLFASLLLSGEKKSGWWRPWGGNLIQCRQSVLWVCIPTLSSVPTLSPPQIPKWTRVKQSMLLRSPHKIENPEGTPRHSQTSGEDRRQSPGSLAARPVVREEHSLCISSKPAARWLPRVREDDRKCGYGHDKGAETETQM